MTLAFLGFVGIAHACDGATTASVREASAMSWESLSKLDIDGFLGHAETVRTAVPCLREPVTPGLAAELHRIEGVRAFGTKDPAAGMLFAAARSVEPGWTFPSDIVPDGHPLRDIYVEVSTEDGAYVDVPRPDVGHLRFDGRDGLRRAISWPTLVQRFDADGAVLDTAYLLPSDAMLVYDVAVDGAEPEPVPVTPLPPEPVTQRSQRTVMLASAGAVGLASIGLYAGALASQARYKETGPDRLPDDKLDAAKGRTNGLVVASGVTGAVAVGLGVVAVAF